MTTTVRADELRTGDLIALGDLGLATVRHRQVTDADTATITVDVAAGIATLTVPAALLLNATRPCTCSLVFLLTTNWPADPACPVHSEETP